MITPALPRIRLLGPRSTSAGRSDGTPPPEDFDLEHEMAGDTEDDEDEGNHWAMRERMVAAGNEAADIPDVDGGDYEDSGWGSEWEDLDESNKDDFRVQADSIACYEKDDAPEDSPPSSLQPAIPEPSLTGPAAPGSTPISEISATQDTQRRTAYIFCPQPHRLPILRLLTKHASQHPLLPERHGKPRTPALIYEDAVREMYQHCELNRLCEVWAYLWNNWYAPSKWKLWARSAHGASIPCHRTTMMVEALWRNIKRLTLHMYNRPPLDLTVWAIVTKTLPPYRHTLAQLINARTGRPRKLTTTQKAFKRSWKRLLKSTLKGSYKTDLLTFTCDCGSQKYHAFLLCKHLVHAAGPLPPCWWLQATRYHVTPFYTIPINNTTIAPPESKRNHGWLARLKPSAPSESESSSILQAIPEHDVTPVSLFY